MNLEEITQKFKDRYDHVHPLIFHRSCNYAKSLGELFDILEDLPKTFPLVWNFDKKRWEEVLDIRKFKTKD